MAICECNAAQHCWSTQPNAHETSSYAAPGSSNYNRPTQPISGGYGGPSTDSYNPNEYQYPAED